MVIEKSYRFSFNSDILGMSKEKEMNVMIAQTLRLPADLHQAIYELAEENLRSWSAQVQYVLQNDSTVRERLGRISIAKHHHPGE